MTEATFRPVAAGVTALLTASVGAITINQTVLWGGSAGGGTGGATATISVRRGQQDLAPEGMVFFAEVAGFDAQKPTDGSVYDPTMHDIYYSWSFGDPGEYTTPLNMIPQWRDKNVAYGPFPAHVFTKAGEYRVILTVYEPSSRKSASAFVDIVVRDPNVVVPAATTVVCSSSSNWTGMPAHDVANRTTTFADAIARLQALKANGAMTRLVFRSGDEFDCTASPFVGSAYRNLHVSAHGAGKAIIHNRTSSAVFRCYSSLPTKGASISGLRFVGGWDSTTETADPAYPGAEVVRGVACESGHVTVHDCEGTGLWQTIFVGGTQDITAIISETGATNWEDYGAYISGVGRQVPDEVFYSYAAFLGCRFAQDVNALQGANGKLMSDRGNRHGPMRIESVGYIYVDCFDAFSRNGWSAPAYGVPADQGCIRDQRNDPRTRGFFSRIMGEGSLYNNGPNTPSATFQYEPCNTVLDKVYSLASARASSNVGMISSALTARNMILHRTNVGTGSTAFTTSLVIGSSGGTPDKISAENWLEPIRAYNITIINECDEVQQSRNGANSSAYEPIKLGFGVNDIQVSNVVVHRPNFPGGFVGDGPINMTRLGLTARYLGYRWKNHENSQLGDKLTMDTSFGQNPASPFSLFRPLKAGQAGAATTSLAIGSATGLVAYDDLLGNVRPAAASRGAIEPA